MAIFNSPYDDNDNRNGTECTILSERVIEPTQLRLLKIQFHSDEFICEVWPEEVIEDESPGHPGETEQDNA